MNANQSEAARQTASDSNRRPRQFAGVLAWFIRHPFSAIISVSALAVVLNCYPIIFCGRSFVSPACTGPLVFDGWQSLPDMVPMHRVWQHASDTDAMMWEGVPTGFLESRSILDHGEIPYWNRYGHAGELLLAQGVSMLGDPLQLIVIFGRGSALAWDVKFLAAKFIFCVGFGWLVLRLLGNQALSLIYAALAAYCGAYIFIDNHPVFFVVAYAPWVLLSAVEILGRPIKAGFKWWLIWLVVNLSCFNGGHIETAVVMIGGLNLTALIFTVAAAPTVSSGIRAVTQLGVAGALFLGLSAPVWLSFLASLPHSYTAHAAIKITQLSPASLPGLFDDVFYHILPHYDEAKLNAPGASLLILTGCIFSALCWRQLRNECFFWVNSTAIIFWTACVFGGIPASLIALVPLLNRVGHVHVDFSYLLIIHLTLQSAFGFRTLLRKETKRQTAFDFIMVLTVLSTMLAVYYSVNSVSALQLNYVLPALAGAVGAPLLFKFVIHRFDRVPVFWFIGIILLGFIPNFRFGLYNFGKPDLMMLPGPREILNASSPSLEKIKSGAEPWRVVGLKNNLAGNYSAVYGLEDIRSCAPLSNAEFIQLMQNFPGISFSQDWFIQVIDPRQAKALLNLLNVKYLLTTAQNPYPESIQANAGPPTDFVITENQEAWPRAFFTAQVVALSSNEEFTSYLLANGKRPFVAVSRAEMDRRPELQVLEKQTNSGTVAAMDYKLLPNSTHFDIQTTSAGVVCLTEGQAVGFRALVNDAPVDIFTVNRAFKGIYLPKPGNYHVEFLYRPPFWRLSCGLFFAAGVIVLALSAVSFVRPKNRLSEAVT